MDSNPSEDSLHILYFLGLFVFTVIAVLIGMFWLLYRRFRGAERASLNRKRYALALCILATPFLAGVIGIEFVDPARTHNLWEIAGLAYIYVMYASTGLRS